MEQLEQKIDATVDISEKNEYVRKKTKNEKDLKKVTAKLEQLRGSPEQRKAYIADCVTSFERDRIDADTDIEYKSIPWMQKMKERILFQFLFDSLIELDENLLREDIELLLHNEDELHASDFFFRRYPVCYRAPFCVMRFLICIYQ